MKRGLIRGLAAWLLASTTAIAATPNVILITADTLRADHLGCYGYFRGTSPAIDQLARDGLLFERALAPMATTLPSHTSIMTSTYPVRHGVLSNLRFFHRPVPTAGDLQTAAQMFKDAGYATAAFTSSSPLSAASGIDAGFDVFVAPPPYDRRRTDFSAEETTRSALAWLSGAPTPFFLWVHLFDPHAPYNAPAPFNRAYVDEPLLFRFLDRLQFPPSTYSRAAKLANLYDDEILYMDGQIARLMWSLKQRSLYDDAVIVFSGDHGEGLLQHNVPGHGIVWNEQLRVPLIFKFPRNDGVHRGRRQDLASLIDILPTITEEAALPLPTDQFDGIDLLKQTRSSVLSQREVRLTTGWRRPLYTLTTARWKYFHYDQGDHPDRLYDLGADPYETDDVIAQHADIASAMRAEIVQLLGKGESSSHLRTDKPVPDGVREQMRQLGYTN